MSNHPSTPNPAAGPRSQRGAALPWVFFGFLAVAGFFFFTEHRAHLLGALPFILLAACPLLHFFHGGHGGHGDHGGSGNGHRGHGPTGTATGDALADAPPQPPSGSAATPPTAPPAPHRH